MGEIGRQLVKEPLATAISPNLISHLNLVFGFLTRLVLYNFERFSFCFKLSCSLSFFPAQILISFFPPQSLNPSQITEAQNCHPLNCSVSRPPLFLSLFSLFQLLLTPLTLPLALNYVSNNNNNNTIFISCIKYTNITPPANSRANQGRWCVDGLRFITISNIFVIKRVSHERN